MSEKQKQPEQSKKTQQNYLDTVIDCISQRNETRVPVEEASITNLYGQAGSMIKQFDSGISRCKKYNEAKINRKYEIIISDLQAQIKRLQDNLKLEQDARSPTKKHVSDILEKLVQLRGDNESLEKQNQELKQKIKDLDDQVSTQTSAIAKIQHQQMKGTIQRLPPIGSSSASLPEGVREYLKDREHVRKITRNPVSKLERWLSQNRPKMWNWNVANLLQQIDQWVQGVKEKDGQEVDMWRIRSSIARRFSDYMDKPQNLLKPSQSMRSQQGLWQKLQTKNMHSAKFSYLGSKRSLNASFH